MKNTKTVVEFSGSRRAAMCRAPTSPLTKHPKAQNCLKRKNAWTAFWSSVFVFFVEGYVMYGASMYPTAAAVAVVLAAAKRSEPQLSIAEQEHSSSLISEDGTVVDLPRGADSEQPSRWNRLNS